MNLDARKFGAATAIVAAIIWIITRLLLLAGPFGPLRAGGYAARGYMMHGHMLRGGYRFGHLSGLGWGGYLAAFVVGLIVFPLVAGLAAWGTAAIYNRLLTRGTAKQSEAKPPE